MIWSANILDYLETQECIPVVLENTKNVLDFSTGKIRHRLRVEYTDSETTTLHMQSFLLKEESEWACISTKHTQVSSKDITLDELDFAITLGLVKYMINTNHTVITTLQELLGVRQ